MTYRSDEGAFQPVIVAFGSHVFGMHPTTGARLWRHDFGAASTVRIAIGGDMLYALGGSDLVCIHFESGRVIGRVTTRACHGATLLATVDRILVGSAGEVQCFSREGVLLWEDLFKGEGAMPVALGYGAMIVQADLTT